MELLLLTGFRRGYCYECASSETEAQRIMLSIPGLHDRKNFSMVASVMVKESGMSLVTEDIETREQLVPG